MNSSNQPIHTYAHTHASMPILGCGIPDEPKNGRARYSTTMIGDEAIYICDENYELKGDSTRRCQRNGLWSGSVPVCECKSTYF